MRSLSRATPFLFGSVLAAGVFCFFAWDLAHHHAAYSPQAPHSSLTRFLPLIVYLAAFVASGLGRLHQRRSRSWPFTPATIESGSVDMVTRDGRWAYLLKASYSYSVDGERYGGNYTELFSTASEAEGVLESLREMPPPVRYKPGDPSESAMEPYRDAVLAVR
jgi:hypothetical protein